MDVMAVESKIKLRRTRETFTRWEDLPMSLTCWVGKGADDFVAPLSPPSAPSTDSLALKERKIAR